MVSMWGSKSDGEDHEDDESATPTHGEESTQTPRRSEGHPPDERSRLLPPRSQGFLSPDDPAVGGIERSDHM